ncbi:erythromycin esterase family protein [Halolamina salifodinae]|uniref:Erythromycin esterase n=1 Tax=Halolamina salifodinae TaxID=1202767 RepID=A0A8T4GZS7_9EURY|nr:erythromycin esterase family protein [Halolamina salifodinae]MBP1986855.1 erythromycin esterase [Halolamina salifodinae]
MSETDPDLVLSVSELASPLPRTDELTAAELPAGLRSRFDDATVLGLGEASHGTREFVEQRFRLTRLLVEEFGVRTVGLEAGFDPLCRVGDRIDAGEGDIRPLLAEIDVYEPMKVEAMADFFGWLRSFNASRPPADRVRLYGFDMTIIEHAALEIEPFLDRVGADIDASLREDLDTMAAGYDDDAERQAMLESAERALSTLQPIVDEHESPWVEATSRRAYEHVRHRLNLIEGQIEAHERDHEGRMALRDETMAENVEWMEELSTGPVVLWGHNGHLNRGRHVLEEWDVDVPSMGEWLADAYGKQYCPVAFGLGGGDVTALDGETGERIDYPIPNPPSESVPAVLRQVDEPLFCLSVDELHEDPTIRDWLGTEPQHHTIWGGHSDGDDPVRYSRSDLSEFDWFCFVRETSPMVSID